jgi:hypothetical protein
MYFGTIFGNAATFQIPCQYLGSYGTPSGDRIARDVCPLWSANRSLRMYYFVLDLDPGTADQVDKWLIPTC